MIVSALHEALPLAKQAEKVGAKFLFLPEYCGGLMSEGAAPVPSAYPEKEHLFLTTFNGLARDHGV